MKTRKVLTQKSWWDPSVACRFKQYISRIFGVKYCSCLPTGDGIPHVHLLLLPGLEFTTFNFSPVMRARVFITAFSELPCMSEMFPHHHHGHFHFDSRVILWWAPASENHRLGSNLKYGSFLHNTLVHCWFIYNSKKWETSFMSSFGENGSVRISTVYSF